MRPGSSSGRPNRRRLLQNGAGLISLCALPQLAKAAPAAELTIAGLSTQLRTAITQTLGNKPINVGKVALQLPALAENGNSVALSVSVDSPMQPQHYVRSIHVFAEKNPLAEVIKLTLGPMAGKAEVATRIRMSDSQTIAAVARLHDDSLWLGAAQTVVTLAACTDYLF